MINLFRFGLALVKFSDGVGVSGYFCCGGNFSFSGLKSSINFLIFIGQGVRDKFLDADAQIISNYIIFNFF